MSEELTPDIIHNKLRQKIELEQLKVRFSNSVTLDELINHTLKFHPDQFVFDTLIMCIEHNVKYKNIIKDCVPKFELLTNDEKEYLTLL